MKGLLKRLLPESIIRANFILTAFIVFILASYLVIQFIFYLQSSSVLKNSRNLVYNQNIIETLYENLLESEISLHFYLQGNVPTNINIFTKLKNNEIILKNLKEKEKKYIGFKFVSKLKSLHHILLKENKLYFGKKQNHLQSYETLKKINETFFLSKEYLHLKKNAMISDTKQNMITLNQSIRFNIIILLLLVLIIISLVSMSYVIRKKLIKKLQFLKDKFRFFIDEREFNPIEYQQDDEIRPVIEAYNFLSKKIHSQHFTIDRLNNYLSSIIDSMPSAIIAIDKNGTITQLNKSSANQFSVFSKKNIGKNIWVLAPFLSKFREYTELVIKKNESVSFHKEHLINSRYHNVTIYPLSIQEVSGVVLRVEEVTELVMLDEQLRQNQKMETIGTLAGGLAHDFNNVLGGISGTVSILKHNFQKNKSIEPDKMNKYIHIIEESTARATDLVQQLLTLSQKRDFKFSTIDLNTSIINVFKICSNTFDKSIEFKYKRYHKPAIVNADPSQIEQVLLNLCINASHALTIMKKEDFMRGGEIEIAIEKIESDKHFCSIHLEAEEISYYSVSVRDNGVGMNIEVLEKIFDPFFTTKKIGEGTGLGLAMSYNIIKQHNGFFDVYSQEDTGSSFILYLPVVQADEIPVEEIETEEIKTGSGLILVIDDEEVMRNITAGILIESGYEVITAIDGAEGVKIYQERKDEISAVILDVIMPRKSGEETLTELNEMNNNVKVLIVSGFKQDERVQRMLNKGAIQFLQKPFNMEKLTNAIWEVLNN